MPTTRIPFAAWRRVCAFGLAVAAIVASSPFDAAIAAEALTAVDPSLTLVFGGTGGGTVTSDPSGINCTSACQNTFTAGTPVTLFATPAAGSQFTGWLGPCSGKLACSVTLNASTSVMATFAPTSIGTPALDIDGNGVFDPAIDGVLVVRYLFGMSGNALLAGINVGAGATRATVGDITGYLDNIRPMLDLDGNGALDPLTDGLLVVRYLFGLRGSALIAGVIGPGATHFTSSDLESELLAFVSPPSLPADPSGVAPPADPTIATTLYGATAFLYTPPNPIQTGVAPGTIVLKRAAVIRGRVLARDNSPLPLVKITILGHTEFGQTYTRSDGTFDMAVNGGAALTVNLGALGFLPAQRSIDVPWQNYVTVPDVVMVPLDAAMTPVSLTAGSPMQSARGSVMSDADGTRQATVIFPAGTQVQMVMPDGSTHPLTALSVRATEYTVGANGQNAMPGGLPAASGYTYAVELSADEAIAAGARGVTFSQPVPFYVENFLAFAVGTQIPLGYYDKSQGKWVPQENGRVIKVVSITAGMADLDLDGDGIADNAAALAALSITDAERTRLATLYGAGQSLWRVLLTHFSPFDCNWPYGPPDGSDSPKPKPKPKPGDPPKGPDPCQKAGSIIECQTQSLHELIPIAGIASKLVYSSSRVPGRIVNNRVLTRLTDATLPTGLQKIHVEVHVAGRVFTTSYAPAINLVDTFTWDGLDAYGRPLYGRQPVTVRVGFEYIAQYFSTPDSQNSSYNRFASPPITTVRAGGGGGGGGGAVTFVRTNVRSTAPPIILYTEYQTTVGTLDVRGATLGGWTLSQHHRYDMLGRVLHLGDGRQRSPEVMTPAIASVSGQGASLQDNVQASTAAVKTYRTAVAQDGSIWYRDVALNKIRRIRPDGVVVTVAGNGHVCALAPCGDGGQATQAALDFGNSVMGFALASDGTFYFADSPFLIRKVTPDGVITTFAGTGSSCSPSSTTNCGDGGPALQANMQPDAMAVGPDGSLYVVDGYRIRRIGTDGIVNNFAGTFAVSCGAGTLACGDTGQATSAKLYTTSALAVDRAGNVYIADGNLNRVRRVGTNGIIAAFAGNGNACFDSVCGDGGPATAAPMKSPFDVAVDNDGGVLIAEGNAGKVRRVGIDGIIRTFAGNGTSDPPNGDGGSPIGASVAYPRGISVAPDGQVVIAQNTGTRIRVTTPAMPGLQAGEFNVAADDGTEVYVFNSDGRHLRTRDALTGAVRMTFGYDAAGRLITMTDGYSNVTTIERDANGNPTAIDAPGGMRTTLTIGADGYLAQVANPASEAYQLTYVGGASPGGLLNSMTDPRNKVHYFNYDADGLLINDQDPAGGTTTLARTELSTDRYKITLTTAAGLVSVYDVETLANGDTQRIRTDPSGAQTTALIHADGSIHRIDADGTITDVVEGPDPRFGLQAPIVKSLTATTPGALVATRTATRTVTLSNASDPLSLTGQTDTVVLNGKTWTSVYSSATHKIVNTSPVGRTYAMTVDALGRIVERQDATGAVLAPIDVTYDSRGRLSHLQHGTQSWDFGFDAQDRLTSRTDAAGKALVYVNDAVGRATQVTLPSGHSYGFAWDAGGNLAQMTAPDMGAAHFAWTPINLESSYTTAGSDVYAFAYDTEMRLSTTTFPDSRVGTFSYDGGNRPTGVTLPEATVGFEYAAGDKTDRFSRITRVPAGGGTTQAIAYTWDGDLMTNATLTGAIAAQYVYTYDSTFLLKSTALTSGADSVTTTRTRDNDGLLTGVGPFTISRNGPAGSPDQFGDGTLAITYAYDTLRRANSRTHAVGGVQKYLATLVFDNAGRISSKTESIAGTPHTWNYTYDSDSQLTQVTRDGVIAERYQYDVNRNRTSRQLGNATAVTATYDGQDRLLQQGGVAWQFGAAGFATQRGADTFTYSAAGELLGATVGAQSVAYAYDALRRRISRTDGAGTTLYLYGNPEDQLQVTDVRSPAGALTTYYYDAAKRLVALQQGATRYYVASDQLGSPRAVIDSAGTVVRSIEYDAFGAILSDSNPAFDLAVGYAGGASDALTGFVRYGLRDYDPASGRWLSRDPALFNGDQANLYAYVANDPVNLVDPAGLGMVGGTLCDGGLCIGMRFSITQNGFSACVDGGVGKGSSLEFDPFADLDKSGELFEAKFSAKAWIAKVEVGGQLDWDDCKNTKGKAEGCIGSFCSKLDSFSPKEKVSIDNDKLKVKDAFKPGGFDWGAKLIARICQQSPWP